MRHTPILIDSPIGVIYSGEAVKSGCGQTCFKTITLEIHVQKWATNSSKTCKLIMRMFCSPSDLLKPAAADFGAK